MPATIASATSSSRQAATSHLASGKADASQLEAIAHDLVGLPKSQLFVVPGSTHVTMVFEKSPLIGGVIVDFLDAKKS